MGTGVAWFGVYAVAVIAALVGNVVYSLAEPGSFLWIWAPLPIATSLILFCLVHGFRRYGAGGIAAYVGIVFTVAWTVEAIGVLTGFPFGAYAYDPWMEPFVGPVPLKVLFAYLSVSYPAWIMANSIAGRFDNRSDGREMTVIAAIAALIMVGWDLPMDPLRATVDGFWHWREPGAWLGIPLTNFFGWFAMSWVMFRLFGAWLLRQRAGLPERDEIPVPCFWIAAPALYLTFLGEYLLNPLVKGGGAALPGDWSAGDVHVGAALAALVSMMPPAVLAIRSALTLSDRTRVSTAVPAE